LIAFHSKKHKLQIVELGKRLQSPSMELFVKTYI
jgi:hypothetical protein